MSFLDDKKEATEPEILVVKLKSSRRMFYGYALLDHYG